MIYTQVTVRAKTHDSDRQVWFFLRTDHQTFADMLADMRDMDGVAGTRIETHPVFGEDGKPMGRRVTSVYETFIDRSIIVSISEAQHPIYDQNMQALYPPPAAKPDEAE